LIKNFEITGDIFYSYAELKKLWVENRENVVYYINRAKIVYNNITEAEKSKKGRLTDSDVVRINGRFVHVIYCRFYYQATFGL